METLLILLPIIVIFVVFVYATYRLVKHALSPYKEEAEKARKSYEAGYYPREINPVSSSRHRSSPATYVPTSVSDGGVYSPPPLTAQDHQMLSFAVKQSAPYIQEVPSVQASTEDSSSGGMDFGWSSTPTSAYEPPSSSYSSSYDSGSSGSSSDFGSSSSSYDSGSSSSSYDSGSSSCSSDFGD